MDVPELNSAFRALDAMLSETMFAPEVDTAKLDALHTAVKALDQEISRKLVVAGLLVILAEYQAGRATLNELGQHFLRAYACEDKK